ncbi:DMT family transporter [Salipiger aestuarii]|uniref:DMT family transporter n=1 Tax=Salipiger aestuarii TaxID=568098 RepID=UPI00123A1F27|nr:DMT family transporter [Salipiger aestuarii]KAA8610285.1 hypothetical protein AL037_13695 [Salipiger aestuarii]
MKTFGLIALTMCAFAANSLLNRAALTQGGMDAASFATLRLMSGAVMLAVLVLATRARMTIAGPGRVAGVAGLLLYIYGFSAAYDALPAGLGALLLFGMVQVTMFAAGVLSGESIPAQRWAGAGLAFAGLAYLLLPSGGAATSLPHALVMLAAGFGWGVYSLAGRLAKAPLDSTATNFAIAAGVGLLVQAGLFAMNAGTGGWPGGWPGGWTGGWTGSGIALAVVSGAVMSGLGYAVWYAVLPRLPGSVAAVAQLTVPIIAMAGGMLFLGEPLTLRFALASALVLGGVAVSVLPLRR